MKLNTKFIFFVLEIALIPLVFASFIFFSNYKIQLEQNTLKGLDSIAQIQKNRIEDHLKNDKTLIELFSNKSELLSYIQQFNTKPTLLLQKNIDNILKEANDGSENIKKILITNTKGTVISSTDSSTLGINISSEDYFNKSLKNKNYSFLNKDENDTIFHYLTDLLILNGETLGIIILATDSGDIINLVNDYTGLGETGETLLGKNDGNGNALYLAPIRFNKNAGLNQIVSKERTDIAITHAINGEENFFNNLVDYRGISVFAATRYIESVDWGIVVKIDKKEALAPTQKMQELFILFIICIIILIIFLTIPIARSILIKEKELDKRKNEFISFASHQLKTPITAISWKLEMLLKDNNIIANIKQKESIEKIYEITRGMMALVTEFLEITKIESDKFNTEKGYVDLLKISDLVLEELAIEISDKKINIIKKYGDNVPTLNIGREPAKIIFQNLISNAVKYTPQNGTIEITIKKNNKVTSISVKDSGYGIPEKDKSRIFTKLFRSDNIKTKEPSGTGLGLYLLKSIVEKLNGKIWFESKEGIGSTFYVNLNNE